MRNYCVLLCLIWSLNVSAQVQSPNKFLGYSLGEKFTPHHRILDYFRHLEKNAGHTMKLIQYGESHEGRPLFIAVITDPENLDRLEQIRMNNLRLALLAKDRMAAQEETPAIVWLSYNVHGNEPSSSEASMMTIHHLLSSADPNIKEWLKNTVVIIDPCLNPDGRDRYVNWYTAVSGKNTDAERITREHKEPSPGGRTNHYYFDLNRDWVWQSQKETKARILEYRKWMPQVHVDYHEQGIDAPYYFAPAAEPYHEVITPWQRSFQDSIGRRHAYYFDRQSWLYFSKLRFDLLSPSYGDTYPTFNGSIGMTYEQAGIGAGLAVITETGDTLTLKDRIAHHFTTSLSTIEISSLNRKKLIEEYRKYFSKAVQAGYGKYKTFLVKRSPGDDQKIDALIGLMENNQIRYGSATGALKGYDYASGTDKTVRIDKGDLVISSLQPGSALLQVLMEPKSALSDSITYDITAWSLPYAYGLEAYASEQIIPVQPYQNVPIKNNEAVDAFGYVIPWSGMKSAKAVGKLLKSGILIRYSELPFTVNGKTFSRGSMIILKTSNQHLQNDLSQLVKTICDEAGISAHVISTGYMDAGPDFGSDLVMSIKKKKVVLVSGEHVSYNTFGSVWHFFDQELEYDLSIIDEKYLSGIDWGKTDVMILSGGDYDFLENKMTVDAMYRWISKGGRLIAMDDALQGLSRLDWGPKLKKTEDDNEKKDVYDPLKIYEKRERDFMKNFTAGSIYQVDLDTTHPLAFGYQRPYYSLKQNDRLFEFITNNGWNVGVIKQAADKAGFVGSKLKSRLKDGLVIGVQNIGRGSVVCFADDMLFRSFWENGKLMFCNAVFFQF